MTTVPISQHNQVDTELAGAAGTSSSNSELPRKNHADEVYFQIPATLWMNANDIPPIEPEDALQTVVLNCWPCEFLDANDPKILDLENDLLGMARRHSTSIARVKDPTLKEKLPRFCDEFLWLILMAWKPVKPTVPDCMIPDNEIFTEGTDQLERTFCSLFELGPDQAHEEQAMNHDQIQATILEAIHDMQKEYGKHDENGEFYIEWEHQAEYDRVQKLKNTTKVKRGQWLNNAGCGKPRRKPFGDRSYQYHYIGKKGNGRLQFNARMLNVRPQNGSDP
jgi:hypothetical protein